MEQTGVLEEDERLACSEPVPRRTLPCDGGFQPRLIWRIAAWMLYAHLAALYGAAMAVLSVQWGTLALAVAFYMLGCLGITAGVHRLFAHRSYRAAPGLRALLAVLSCIAFQKSCIRWVRDHRVHHRYSETDADPHNASRGFFFSHIGWVMCNRHPDCTAKLDAEDVSDLTGDPILAFQHRHYAILTAALCFVLPSLIPVWCWGEALHVAWHVNMLRYILLLHATFFVNSYAHMFGNRPYDKYIGPGENLLVSLTTLGEGWHNFHHTFPWDYRCAELGNHHWNLSTAFINFFAWIGWASDLKTVSATVIQSRVARTGDGNRSR